MVLELPRNTGSRSSWQQLLFLALFGRSGCHKEPVLLPTAPQQRQSRSCLPSSVGSRDPRHCQGF